MDCLVEVHSEAEIRTALDCGAEITGINNRDLKTLAVDTATVRRLRPLVPADRGVMFAGHWGETAHFVRVLRGEEQLIVKKEEVLNVMATLDALYLSAAEGREVRIA